ncbi:hypothetical protein ABE905_13605 [Enterococcus durans]|uniref:hypothetical protein n=1 Tax=Enterococcus durans TaxID=53345 RepID=UPI003D6B9FB1
MNSKVRLGIVGTTCILILGIGLLTINESTYSKKVEAIASDQLEHDQRMQEIKKKMNTLYYDDDKQFLNAEISQENIESLEGEVNKLSDANQIVNKKIGNLRKNDQEKYKLNVNKLSALQKEVKVIQQKFTAQENMNGLFQSPYLKGSAENGEVTINDDLTTEKLNEVKKILLQEENGKDKTNKFEIAINNGAKIAQNQLEQIAKTKKVISELYKEGKVTDKVTKETYESVKKEVELIKNKKAKETFTEALNAIETKVQEDEAYKQKLEAEKQIEEAKRQAEAEKQAEQEVQTMQGTVEDTSVQETPITTPVAETPTHQQAPPANATGGSDTINNPNNSASNTGGSNTGGSSNSGGSGGNTTPTPPVQEKPYALNPYGGSGTMYLSYAAAAEVGEKHGIDGGNSYTVYTEMWSDGSKKYYLELY